MSKCVRAEKIKSPDHDANVCCRSPISCRNDRIFLRCMDLAQSASRRISHLAPSIRWRVMLRCMSSGIGTKPECRRVRSHGGDRGSSRPRLNDHQTTQMIRTGFLLDVGGQPDELNDFVSLASFDNLFERMLDGLWDDAEGVKPRHLRRGNSIDLHELHLIAAQR